MATAEKRVVTEATGQAMLAELRKIPGVMNPVPIENGGTGVTTPEEILEVIGAEPKLPINVVEELGARVKSVNGNLPDNNGNVTIMNVASADNLSSDESTTLNGTFICRTTGGDASISSGVATITALYGYSIRVGYVAETKSFEVIPVGRLDDSVIVSAEMNWDTYRTAVNNVSTNKTFTYGASGWSENPETYGLTITGTPVSGDVINVYFTAENRGTISNATPEKFVETNWNLYDHDKGYAKVMKYSDDYGFKIGGEYTSVGFASTLAGAQTVVTPNSNGLFTIPEDGYVFVVGGNDTDTYILMTWSDWQDGYTGSFMTYAEDEVDFSELMENTFPFGLCSIGIVSDEINFSEKTAYVRIERMAYSAENKIIAENSGRSFTYDANYIYIVKETPEKVRFNIDSQMTVYDHGVEFFTGTELPVTIYQLFGQNLKDKLRRDVVTVTPQNFSVAQKAQARQNIDAAFDQEVIKTINHKTPDQYGDITIVEGTANASYGLYRINTVIQPAAWSLVNGAYQVAYADNLIKSDMDGMETWLDNPEAMLGKTRFTTIDGALIISTAVQPVEAWSLHVALGTNGATVLEQVHNKAEENTVALVETGDTAFHNISKFQYVIWKGTLYKATTAITAGGTLASTGNNANLSACSDGISNELGAGLNKLLIGEYIPNNADLNDYKTPGYYAVANADASRTISNIPYQGIGGGLKVELLNTTAYEDSNAYRCVQTYYVLDGRAQYIRTLSSYGWSEWHEVVTDYNIDSLMTDRINSFRYMGSIGGDSGGTYTFNFPTAGQYMAYTFRTNGGSTYMGVYFIRVYIKTESSSQFAIVPIVEPTNGVSSVTGVVAGDPLTATLTMVATATYMHMNIYKI